MTSRLSSILATRRALIVAIALSMAVASSSISVGFLTDDHGFRAMLHTTSARAPAAHDLFRFVPGDPADNQLRIRFGRLPWWSAGDLRIHFLRPLTSLAFAADDRMFGASPLGYHLVSLGWYLALVVCAALLFRRLLPPAAATLAVAMFGLAAAHVEAYAWISARHVAIAGALSAASLAVQAGRRGRWLAPPLLVAALAASEAALAAVPLAIALVQVQPARSRAARWRDSAIPVVLAIGYLVVYTALGFGARASGGYHDPAADPLGFVALAAQRMPILLGDAALGIPAELAHVMPPWQLALIGVAAVVIVGLAWLAMGRARSWHAAVADPVDIGAEVVVRGHEDGGAAAIAARAHDDAGPAVDAETRATDDAAGTDGGAEVASRTPLPVPAGSAPDETERGAEVAGRGPLAEPGGSVPGGTDGGAEVAGRGPLAVPGWAVPGGTDGGAEVAGRGPLAVPGWAVPGGTDGGAEVAGRGSLAVPGWAVPGGTDSGAEAGRGPLAVPGWAVPGGTDGDAEVAGRGPLAVPGWAVPGGTDGGAEVAGRGPLAVPGWAVPGGTDGGAEVAGRAPLSALGWLALGGCGATVLGVAGFPAGRMLVIPDLAFAAVLGAILHRALVLGATHRDPRQGAVHAHLPRSARIARRVGRVLAALLAIVHLVLAPLASLREIRKLARRARASDAVAADIVRLAPPSGRVFLIAASDPGVFLYPRAILSDVAPGALRCWSVLSAARAGHRVTRTTAHSLTIEPIGRTLLEGSFDTLFRAPDRRFHVGDTTEQCGATIRIAAVEAGRPARLEVTLRRRLDDPELGWLVWQAGGLSRFALPAIGESAVIPWAPGPSGAL